MRWLGRGRKRCVPTSVNWYGAESKDFVVAGLDRAALPSIAALVRTLGFNSVRLPWSNELVETNPVVDPARVAENPALAGLHALDVLDAVVAALAHEGLVVVLDNHRSHADWCCDVAHGDGLWYAPGYPESSFLADWTTIAKRYASQPAVVGADLRNELRTMLDPGAPATCTACGTGCPCLDPTWTGDNGPTDWYGAAQRAGNAVLAANPGRVPPAARAEPPGPRRLLAARLRVLARGVRDVRGHGDGPRQPLGIHPRAEPALHGARLGGRVRHEPRLAGGRQRHERPGLLVPEPPAVLANADVDWSYWALNGTEATGYSTLGAEEGYGVLDTTWSGSALPDLTKALQASQPATQGP
jgi:endoglucanase